MNLQFPTTSPGIESIPQLTPTGPVTSPTAPSPQKTDFQQLLTQAMTDVGHLQSHSQLQIEQYISGEDITQAEVFSSIKKADLALRTMIQIRNKLLEAFNEIQQIRI